MSLAAYGLEKPDWPNISKPVLEIMEILGLDPDDVRDLTIRPTAVSVRVYRRNSVNQKYVDRFGDPALDYFRVPVIATEELWK